MKKYKCSRRVEENLSIEEIFSFLMTSKSGEIKCHIPWIGLVEFTYMDEYSYYGVTTKQVLSDIEAALHGTLSPNWDKGNWNKETEKIYYQNAILLRANGVHVVFESIEDLKKYIELLTLFNIRDIDD